MDNGVNFKFFDRPGLKELGGVPNALLLTFFATFCYDGNVGGEKGEIVILLEFLEHALDFKFLDTYDKKRGGGGSNAFH